MIGLLKFLFLFINIMTRIFIRFFTGWGFVLQVLYYLGFLRNYQESILYTLILISVCGLIITYINPKFIKIPYLNIKIQGKTLQILDIIGHHLPLIVFLYQYDHKIKSDNLILFFSILTIYLLFINPFRVYNFICLKLKNKM